MGYTGNMKINKLAHILVFWAIFINGKNFKQQIFPYIHKHRVNKNIADAPLHCKRD